MKRYFVDDIGEFLSKDGEWYPVADVNRMRRRLIRKLLLERADCLEVRAGNLGVFPHRTSLERSHQMDRNADWCRKVAKRLEES